MTKNYDAVMTLSDNLADALYVYATLDLDDLSDAEKEAQKDTCRDIADFIVFSMGIDANLSEDGKSFTATGVFSNPVDMMNKFLEI
jgi:hypothetical protein